VLYNINPVVTLNFFTEEELILIYNEVNEKNINDTLSFEPTNNTYFNKVKEFGYISTGINNTIIKNKIIKKSQEIFKFSNDNPLIHFARYSNYSGSNPDLAPHVDSFLEYPTYTFSIQLKTTKPEWIIRVDDHSFKLKENSCISFSGTHQIHSRDPIQFSDEDYCDIIVCQFTDNSYSSIKNDVSHQEIINNKFNIHRQKYRK